MTVTHIGLGQLRPSKFNPRTATSKEKLEKLAESIRHHGVLQQLIVRGNAKGYELVTGHRRLEAARIAGLKQVPCEIRELTDEQAREIQLVENLQREDLGPLDEAQGYGELLATNKKLTVDALAQRISCSKSYIFKRLKLLELAPAGRKLLQEGQIDAAHALLVARLQSGDQREALKYISERRRYGGETPSVRELSAWIEREVTLLLKAVPWDPKDDTLDSKAGACEGCQKRTGSNPTLFDDVIPKWGDACTDRACYAEKLQRHMGRKVTEIKGTGGKVAYLAPHFIDPDELGMLGKAKTKLVKEWNTVARGKEREECENLAKGIHVAGPERGKVQEVCLAKTCKVHAPKHQRQAERALPPAERAKRDKEKLDQKVHRAELGAVVDVVLDRVETGKGMKPALLSLALRETVIGEFWSDVGKELAARQGWLGEKKKSDRSFHDVRDIMRKQTANWNVEQLTKLLVSAIVIRKASDARGFRGVGTNARDFKQVASAAGVDWTKVAGPVSKELREKARKRAERAQARARGKGPKAARTASKGRSRKGGGASKRKGKKSQRRAS